MLLGDDFTLLDYKFDIDADNEIKLADCVLFNEVSKTYKVRKNDKIIDVVDEREIKRKNTNNLSSYSHGEGKIEANDLDNYVSNYFSGGILDESYSVPMKRHTQQDLSIYKKRVGDVYTSEGNCWLCGSYNSLYQLMFDSEYKTSLFSDFETYKTTFFYSPSTEEPATFSYAQGLGYAPYNYGVSHLYADLRKKALRMDYKSPIDGLSTENTLRMINGVMDDYGCSIRATKESNYNAYTGTEAFKKYFRNGKTAVFDSDGGSYGQHIIAVNGYRHYKREQQFLWWSYTEWRTFLEVADGHSARKRYFDITRYYQEMNTGAFLNFSF